MPGSDCDWVGDGGSHEDALTAASSAVVGARICRGEGSGVIRQFLLANESATLSSHFSSIHPHPVLVRVLVPCTCGKQWQSIEETLTNLSGLAGRGRDRLGCCIGDGDCDCD